MKANRAACILATVALLSLLAVSEASLFSRARPDWSVLGWRGTSKTVASVSYNATATRLNNDNPLIDSQVPKSSVFTYNYNAAVVPNAVRSASMQHDQYLPLFSLLVATSLDHYISYDRYGSL